MTLIYLFCYIFIIFFVGLIPFNFFQTNNASLSEVSGLKTSTPGIVYTQTPPVKLSAMKQFTIIMNLSSYLTDWTSGYARILTYSLDGNKMNFMVSQWDDSLIFRTNADNKPKTIHFETERFFNKNRTTVAAIVYDGKTLASYRDGVKMKEMEVGSLTFNNWNKLYPLVIGSDANGKNCWAGYLYSIRISDRAFSPGELGNRLIDIAKEEPLIWYAFKENTGKIVVDLGRGRAADLIIPGFFTPYKRAMFEFEYEWLFENRHYYVDLWIDIVGFIPLGFLLAAYLTRRKFSFLSTVFYSVLLGAVVSSIVEFLQTFLSTRASSLVDVISNTLGACLGVILYSQAEVLRGRQMSFGISETEKSGAGDPSLRKDSMQRIASIDNRHILFMFAVFVGLAMLYNPLRDLMRTQYASESYLHIIIIPLISGYLIYERWDSLVPKFSYSVKSGLVLLVVGVAFYFLIKRKGFVFNKNDYAALVTLSTCIFMLGAFVLLYGWGTFKSAMFPFLFILFVIPIPSPILKTFVDFLQYGSTQFSWAIFTLIGIPFQKYGYVFVLPNNVAVEVADPCSGIHSTIALLIVGILAGHLLLRTAWKKVVLVLLIFPLALVKNSFRIVFLSILGVYVDERILTQGFLHKSGGFIFYIPALILLFLILWLLKKSESKRT